MYETASDWLVVLSKVMTTSHNNVSIYMFMRLTKAMKKVNKPIRVTKTHTLIKRVIKLSLATSLYEKHI